MHEQSHFAQVAELSTRLETNRNTWGKGKQEELENDLSKAVMAGQRVYIAAPRG